MPDDSKPGADGSGAPPAPAARPGAPALPYTALTVPVAGPGRRPAAPAPAPAAAAPTTAEAAPTQAAAPTAQPASEPAGPSEPAEPAAAPRRRRQASGRKRGRRPKNTGDGETAASSHRSLMLSTDNLCYLDDAERDILRGSDYTVTVNRSLLLRAIIDGLEMADFDLAEVALKDPGKKPQLAIAEHIAALLGAG